MNNNTGPCTVSGNLPSDVAYMKGVAKLNLYINNSQCKKMAKKTQLKVHMKITAKAKDITGTNKEWTDDQVVMAGEFTSLVAKQDPNIAPQEFGITCDKIPGIDCEKNRYTMLNDFEDGKYIGQ